MPERPIMKSCMMLRNRHSRPLLWLWLLPAGLLLYLLAPVLTPFVIAAALAYLANPLVNRLQRLPRSLAVSLIFVLIFGLLTLGLLILLPILEKQIGHLLTRLPVYLTWLEHTILPWVEQFLPAELPAPKLNAELIRQAFDQLGGVASDLWQTLTGTGRTLLHWLTNLLLIPVLTFYLLRDWPRVTHHIRQLIPRAALTTSRRLGREADQVLGKFMRGQLSVMLALAILYTCGLWLIELDFALLIGIFAGAVSFVPYLGLIVGLLVAGIASILQFQDLSGIPLVILVFGVVQILESVILTPRLVGDSIGLHPVAVIFAVLAGGQLYGFIGVLLALPVAAVGMVLIRELLRRYQQSLWYHGTARCN